MWVHSRGQEHPLEEGMETHSSILAWRIPRTEEPGGLWYKGSQRVRMTEATSNTHTHTHTRVSYIHMYYTHIMYSTDSLPFEPPGKSTTNISTIYTSE